MRLYSANLLMGFFNHFNCIPKHSNIMVYIYIFTFRIFVENLFHIGKTNWMFDVWVNSSPTCMHICIYICSRDSCVLKFWCYIPSRAVVSLDQGKRDCRQQQHVGRYKGRTGNLMEYVCASECAERAHAAKRGRCSAPDIYIISRIFFRREFQFAGLLWRPSF